MVGETIEDVKRQGQDAVLYSGSIEVPELEKVQVNVHIIDALASLIDALPRVSLSSEPITTPWHLGGSRDRPSKGNASNENDDEGLTKRKRRKIGSRCGVDIDLLVSAAHTHLREVWKASWLTTRSMATVHIGALEDSEPTAWADLEARQAHDVEEVPESDLIHRTIFNDGNQARIYGPVLLPSHSGFHITNLLRSQLQLPQGWTHVLEHARKYPPSLVLVDPPYPNISASRLRKGKREAYQTVDDLFDLWKMVPAVQTLIGEDTLVGCWVTNHAKIQAFVLEKLFHAWDLEYIGQLIWVKVTSGETAQGGGQLVVPLQNSAGRKPYKFLLLGRRKKPTEAEDRDRGICSGRLVNFVACSVPLQHSRKPDVVDVLRPLVPGGGPPNVYDIFGRIALRSPKLSPGPEDIGAGVVRTKGTASSAPFGSFLSIGNQACLFNEISGQK